MAELTYLNEASVVHNLNTRYQADLIYVSYSEESRLVNYRKEEAHNSPDLFGPFSCDSQSVLPVADIHARSHKYVPRAKPRGHQTPHICCCRRGISESRP